jgi:hypothetical protein
MKSVLVLILGVAIGAAVAWIPYGYAALSAVVVMMAIYGGRYVFDRKFRESPKCAQQFNFYVVFWIVIGIFYIRPSGIDTFLPPVNVNNAKVGDLLEKLGPKAPNVEFVCDPSIAEKKISIHTMTKITIGETLDLIDVKAGAKHEYRQDAHGRSIALGPRMTVKISRGGKGAAGRGEPFIYDAY